MFRPISLIIAAILLAQPTMPRGRAARYAKVLQREAKEHGFDPFTGVAIIRRESRWHSGAVSADGEDYGLAQIRARYIGACRRDPDPVNAPGPACQAAKRALLNGEYNIKVMATLITRNREMCKQRAGSALFARWLASYEGRNYPKRDRWCQPGEATFEVIHYRRWLVSKLVGKDRSSSKRRRAVSKRHMSKGRPRASRRR